jgi:hypothetical protein
MGASFFEVEPVRGTCDPRRWAITMMMCSNKSTFHMQEASKEPFGHVIVVCEKVLVDLTCHCSRVLSRHTDYFLINGFSSSPANID